MTSDQTLLTTSEAAKEFNVAAGTVRRWIRENQIPAITHPSGRRRIRRADVEAILAGKTAGPAPAEASAA